MKSFLLLLSFITVLSLQSQTTVNILLSQGSGEDAYLASGAPNSNYGSHPSMGGNTWTCGGNLCLSRAVFKFDLSSLPPNAFLLNASLQLFADLNWSPNATTGSPNNSGFLSRITSPWTENSVTWGNQPSVALTNQLSVPGSMGNAQNYTLNVTALVQDILTSQTNYGFMLKMQDEVNYYLSLMFASSDNAVAAKCPVLSLTYLIPTVAVSTSTLGCNGLVTATANVSGGSGNYSFTWTPSAQTNSVASSLVPGVYTISVLDNTYNYNFSYTTTVLNPITNFTCNALSTPLCGTSNATVFPTFGSGNYNYLWTPSSQVSAVANSLTAGTYTVAVNDITNNCSVSRTLQITPYTFPNLIVSPNATICPKQALTLNVSGANTYSWSSGSTATSIVVAPSVNTFYTVSGVSNPGNCVSSKTIAVTVAPCTGIDANHSEDMAVHIYPNPFESTLHIRCVQEMKKIVLFDMLGNRIIEENISGKEYELNKDLLYGLYVLSIYGENNKELSRSIISKSN